MAITEVVIPDSEIKMQYTLELSEQEFNDFDFNDHIIYKNDFKKMQVYKPVQEGKLNVFDAKNDYMYGTVKDSDVYCLRSMGSIDDPQYCFVKVDGNIHQSILEVGTRQDIIEVLQDTLNLGYRVFKVESCQELFGLPQYVLDLPSPPVSTESNGCEILNAMYNTGD